ncbi:MAG TPA: PQQ-binding-like beta-propeller repeat protein [Blastocatellia bacterium]|nr:PQQ-binding-like beta-propeller repeat protein [Blastocatellia bacterium]HMY70393.1 PQQ-binding-like beta-propeller repeat protein [Blastocatellia bacterium]HMZ16917.1 PQQ-binding-like beta-propeller repeat protein [Blastocatellia bacterium]HNG29382.1 PQQ-binding-like beta-propeller repeat protein [Blastocatellia bacterium]
MTIKNWKFGLAALLGLLGINWLLPTSPADAGNPAVEWPVYGGNSENTHFSTLKQINRDNVKQLQVAWTYDTGDVFEGSELQCNPIIIGDTLYATSPKLRVFALDAATGKQRWSFDPNEGQRPQGAQRNRGVTYWAGDGQPRIYFAFRNWLYALDAKTGQPVKSFGNVGRVDLREGLGRPDAERLTVGITTPGVIYKDLLIVGSIVSESLPAAPGHIRAYDLRTGKLRWIFHTIPHPGEYGYDTWPKDAWHYSGGTNAWAGLALDEKRGLLFAPTGSATYDFYGANRHGDNLFSNTLLCLNAATGERKWHFQTIRHDMWDRDLPMAPALVTIRQEERKDGRTIDAVAQTTKSGHIFVFERETGKPVFPIEYHKVSTAGLDGEQPADTQPLPVLPPPIGRQMMTEAMVTNRTPEAHRDALERFRKLRSVGQFDPPGLQGSIVLPGFDGGPGWGGGAFDAASGLFIINSNEVPCILKMVERPKSKAQESARSLFARDCASCHGKDWQGSPPQFPALIGLESKYKAEDLHAILRNGIGRMPGFAALGDEGIKAVTHLLLTGEDTKIPAGQGGSAIDLKYTIEGYTRFFDKDGYPAITPPWGTLNAVDLNQGKIVWQVPLGEHPELAAKGIKDTGSWNYGGPILTAGGLVFIGATNYDKKFRAFDVKNGKLLWESVMPASGNATPATYEINGRQFVVIAAGGGKRGGEPGGKYIAFALPQRR